MAPRIQLCRRFFQSHVASAFPVLPGPVSLAAKQKPIPILPKGELFLPVSNIHTVDFSCPFQCQHIGALLMHSRKIHSRELQKRIMYRKHNLGCQHIPARCSDQMILYFCNYRIFINLKSICQLAYKFQRMKLSLTEEPNRSCTIHRNLQMALQRHIDPKPFCRFCFLHQLPLIFRINKSVCFLKITVYFCFLYDSFVFLHRLLVRLHIFSGGLFSLFCKKCMTEHPMLGCDLCCCVLCLAPSYLICLQHYSSHSSPF